MNNKFGLTGVSALLALATLAACGGGDGSATAPPPAPKVWGTASPIETDNTGDAYYPQIAFDSNGNALAVWEQFDGTRHNVVANRFIAGTGAGTGWGTASLIETDNTGGARSLQIAVDTNGNALAVWMQSDRTRNNIWANRFIAGNGWGTASLIETNDVGGAYAPNIAIDTSGNALAVWQQYNGTRSDVWANRFIAGTGTGTGWGTASLIETDNAGSAYSPNIAIDTNGNALAVWQQFDGTRYNVVANRFTAGTGWGTASLIETDNAGDPGEGTPDIAIDTNGNALAVWFQSDGTRYNIWANRFIAGTGWGTASLIETDNAGDASSPRIAFDSHGNALAVWQQFDGTRENIWANRFIAGTGWGTAALIETDDVGRAIQPQIAIDANGNALAVWQQFDGTRNNIWANRFIAGTGWGTASLIENDNVGNASSPQIAIDTNGNALAVWEQSDGTRNNIWANRFQ